MVYALLWLVATGASAAHGTDMITPQFSTTTRLAAEQFSIASIRRRHGGYSLRFGGHGRIHVVFRLPHLGLKPS